jgi:hypothetical protein
MPVPWSQIIQWAPQIISLSRELLQRARGGSAPDKPAAPANPEELASRVAALEDNERRQAELVDRMAAQQAQLSHAVLSLHRQLRALVGVVIVLAVVLIWRSFAA